MCNETILSHFSQQIIGALLTKQCFGMLFLISLKIHKPPEEIANVFCIFCGGDDGDDLGVVSDITLAWFNFDAEVGFLALLYIV